jgi:hypothetical protein
MTFVILLPSSYHNSLLKQKTISSQKPVLMSLTLLTLMQMKVRYIS